MVILCVCDHWKKREFYKIDDIEDNRKIEPLDLSNDEYMENRKTLWKRIKCTMDGISAFYIKRDILIYNGLRKILIEKAQTLASKHSAGFELLVYIKIVSPRRDIIDYKWNDMLAHTLWQKIELDYLMSWLSTLGGGYSALGEQFSRCAETAGKISLKQLDIGLRLGDPFLQSRCKLYYSISLIQMKRLRAAKYIIREQYKFAKQHIESDGRLVKMCQGIWLRLQFEYGLRIKERERHKSLPNRNGNKLINLDVK